MKQDISTLHKPDILTLRLHPESRDLTTQAIQRIMRCTPTFLEDEISSAFRQLAREADCADWAQVHFCNRRRCFSPGQGSGSRIDRLAA